MVSRARCGILHAAPQNRDRTKHRRSVRPRLCSAPLRKSYALRCVRGTGCGGKHVNRPRFLRVGALEDGETVHNAFFDRDFREEEP